MKKNKSLIKTLNWVLAGLLAILGFSNCEPRVEYGTPNASYTVKGKVVNKEDLKPIKGIRIGYGLYPGPVLMYGVIPAPYTQLAADSSNITGDYKLTQKFYAGDIPENETPVYVQDVDGNENGLFRDTVINVNFDNATRSGKRTDWYEGELSIELDIELTPKKEGNE
ncbi:MAG: radical SAM-associated putative lipoprotein [Paludibacter sp.]|nr:radical SAM-associated putative lipoprotein [Paludibacter sp.]